MQFFAVMGSSSNGECKTALNSRHPSSVITKTTTTSPASEFFPRSHGDFSHPTPSLVNCTSPCTYTSTSRAEKLHTYSHVRRPVKSRSVRFQLNLLGTCSTLCGRLFKSKRDEARSRSCMHAHDFYAGPWFFRAKPRDDGNIMLPVDITGRCEARAILQGRTGERFFQSFPRKIELSPGFTSWRTRRDRG